MSLDVFPGEVVALLGENGAGKSTLIKVLAGVYTSDEGQITFQGNVTASAAALKTATTQPIAFIHQDLGLIEWMTVAENMALVMGFSRRFGLVNWRAVRERARMALEEVGIQLDPDARVFELSRTEKSLLAIARAVAVNAEVLVLDEPTASLPANDVRHLFGVIERLKSRNVGMIYVTHRLDEVIEIADRICVMRDGRRVAEGVTADYMLHDLVEMIVGEALESNQRLPLPEARRLFCCWTRCASMKSVRSLSACNPAKCWRWQDCAVRSGRDWPDAVWSEAVYQWAGDLPRQTLPLTLPA